MNFCNILLFAFLIARARLQKVANKQEEIRFDKYLDYREIQQYLNALTKSHKEIVNVTNFGLSVENRNLTCISIASRVNEKRPLIFIDAGIHAREWIGPAQALYAINQLVKNPNNSALIKGVDWLFVPLINPDGYEYSRRVTVEKEPCSREKWLGQGASDNECSNFFAGSRPFSEPESYALSKLITENAKRIKMYVSLHAAAQSVLYPWGYTKDLPQNGKELHQLATRVSDAVHKVNLTRYKIGSAANILYLGSGSSCDWAYAVANIKLCYTIELRGVDGKKFKHRFEIPPHDILHVVSEMFEGLKELHSYVENRFGSKS